MSVLSKALQIAVLVTVCGGCATNSSKQWSSAKADTPNENIDSAFTPEAGVPAQELAADAATDSLIAEAPSAPSTQELLAATDAGFDVQLERGTGYSKILISGANGEQPEYQVSTMNQPSRLIVDLLGTSAKGSRSVDLADNEFVQNIRVGSHSDRTRVVLDLTSIAADEATTYRTVDRENGKIAVTFRNAGSATAAKSTAVDTTTSPAENVVAQNSAAPVDIVNESVPPAFATIDGIQLSKTQNSAGQVAVSVNGSAPFALEKTAASEYVLKIQGAQALEDARLPQLAAPGKAGIRSTRTVQDGDNVLVRMFVDQGVELRAFNRGEQIVVVAKSEMTQSEARAQLEAPATEAPAENAQVTDGDQTARVNPTGIPSADGSKIYTGRLISLDLQETDIDNALRIIAEVSNLNIIASDDVAGKVTLRLVDVPWDQALDVILKTNGLDQVTEGNVIRIAPVDKLRQEREALREAMKAAENLEDLRISYTRISYARASDLKEQIESVLSERGSVAIDERTNQLIVKDIQKGQEAANALVKKLDLRTPQVLLETQVVEATRSLLRDLGFQWNFSLSQSAATGNATGQNFPNSIVSGGAAQSAVGTQAVNFPAAIGASGGSAIAAVLDSADGSRFLAMRLSALEQEGKVKVVSRPQVATINNKEAEIKSVEKLRVRLPDSGLSVATGQGASAAGGAASAFEEIDVGITLRVTPQASPDYYVLLDVYAKSSTLGANTVDEIPSTLEREATSSILVKSGQTFALGGVYRLRENDRLEGVPFLKDIPVLGVLFRRTLTDKADEELIFFITPHIVEGSFDPSLM